VHSDGADKGSDFTFNFKATTESTAEALKEQKQSKSSKRKKNKHPGLSG